MNYYNEFDPKAAAWLRELIARGYLPHGDIDTRSICDVQPGDLKGYTQCHFFAGIGGWSLALQIAGWTEDRPVWTGSCPCQPFSVAGKGRGTEDERHLWPVFTELIRACKPPVVFGEQVASKAGREWLAGVFADLEAMAYQRAGADLCAAGVGAPHIRQRLFWMAYNESDEWLRCFKYVNEARGNGFAVGSETGGVAHSSSSTGLAGRQEQPTRREQPSVERSSSTGGVVQSDMHGCEPGCVAAASSRHRSALVPAGSWADSRIIECRDGKARRIPVEPRFFPLAHGIPGRVGLLRGYGNAIVPQAAAEFIQAAEEAAAMKKNLDIVHKTEQSHDAAPML